MYFRHSKSSSQRVSCVRVCGSGPENVIYMSDCSACMLVIVQDCVFYSLIPLDWSFMLMTRHVIAHDQDRQYSIVGYSLHDGAFGR